MSSSGLPSDSPVQFSCSRTDSFMHWPNFYWASSCISDTKIKWNSLCAVKAWSWGWRGAGEKEKERFVSREHSDSSRDTLLWAGWYEWKDPLGTFTCLETKGTETFHCLDDVFWNLLVAVLPPSWWSHREDVAPWLSLGQRDCCGSVGRDTWNRFLPSSRLPAQVTVGGGDTTPHCNWVIGNKINTVFCLTRIFF